jgi:hypothetical protein
LNAAGIDPNLYLRITGGRKPEQRNEITSSENIARHNEKAMRELVMAVK